MASDGWPGAPHGSRTTQRTYYWKTLLAFHWDSSGWSAVGMAGSGSDGMYLIRPGLVAVVHQHDNEVEVRADKVDRRTTDAMLVRHRLDRIVSGDGSGPRSPWPRTASAATTCVRPTTCRRAWTGVISTVS